MTREQSTEERTAGCGLQPSLLFSLSLLLFSLEEVGEEEDGLLSL